MIGSDSATLIYSLKFIILNSRNKKMEKKNERIPDKIPFTNESLLIKWLKRPDLVAISISLFLI